MPKRPKPRRQLVYMQSVPKELYIRLYATPEVSAQLTEFGHIYQDDEDQTLYLLYGSPLYEFEEVVQYVVDLAEELAE